MTPRLLDLEGQNWGRIKRQSIERAVGISA